MKTYKPYGFNKLGRRKNNEDLVFPDPKQASTEDRLSIACNKEGGGREMSFGVILKKSDTIALFSIVVALTILGTTGCARSNQIYGSKGLAMVEKEGKYGLVDQSGALIVPFK